MKFQDKNKQKNVINTHTSPFESMLKSKVHWLVGIFSYSQRIQMPTNNSTTLHVNKYLKFYNCMLNVEMLNSKQGKSRIECDDEKGREIKIKAKYWRALFHLLFITVNWFIQLMSPLNGRGAREKNEEKKNLLSHSLIIIIWSECFENGK